MTLGRAVVTIGGLTMLSRVAGFIRDFLIARLLGAGPVADAFFIAFKLPNFFRRLFAEGAFNFAFVPIFAGTMEKDGPEAARDFAERAQALLMAFLLPFTVLCIVAMSYVVLALAPGTPHDKPQVYMLAVEYSRITFAYILFISLASLLSGVLNTLGKFAAPAASPILLNFSLISATVAGFMWRERAGELQAWGVFVAGILQYLLVAYAAARAGVFVRPALPRWSPRMKRLMILIVPAAIGSGAQQVNAMLDVVWASFLPQGSISYLYYADRINQLPLGVVGVAIATALLPLLARQIKAGALDAAMSNQNRAIEFALLLTLPATAGLIALHEPIVRALFAYGAFDETTAVAVADALAAFAFGLPAFVLVKVFAPGFYAREDTRTPLYIALATIAVNTALNAILIWKLRHVGIAASASLAGWFNALTMAIVLHRRGFLAIDAQLRRRGPRLALAAIVLGVALALAGAQLAPWFRAEAIARVGMLALLLAGALALYFGLSIALGAFNLPDLRRALTRVPRRKGETPLPTDSV